MKTVVEVSGMTCNHCVQTVTKEVAALPGVSHVAIELNPSGKSLVSVTHDSADLIGALAGAVSSAGYILEAVVSQS